jgi:hypothetical protein
VIDNNSRMMHPSNQNMMLICWFVDYDGSCDPKKMHRPNLSKNLDGSLVAILSPETLLGQT